MRNTRFLAVCCGTMIVALLVVGIVSSGILRHVVQTSPLWVAIVLGGLRSRWTKWVALPCFVFWLLLMTAIWLYLFGWAHVVSGSFSRTEIAMTLVVGISALAGIAAAIRNRSDVPAWPAIAVILLVAAGQVLAIWLSQLRGIAHD